MLISRAVAAVVGVALVAGVAVGCAPGEPPTPTPTALTFSSEEEAYAAAEEVYRAYNDALNAQRVERKGTDPNVYLTGLALESAYESERRFEELGISLDGPADVSSFRPVNADLETVPNLVSAVICSDVSKVRVLDRTGLDVTPSDRGDVVSLYVTFVSTATGLQISGSEVPEGEDGC